MVKMHLADCWELVKFIKPIIKSRECPCRGLSVSYNVTVIIVLYIWHISDDMYMARCSVYAISEE